VLFKGPVVEALVEALPWADLNQLSRSCHAAVQIPAKVMNLGLNVHVHQRRMEKAVEVPERSWRTLPSTAIQKLPVKMRARNAKYKRCFAVQVAERLLAGGNAAGVLHVQKRDKLITWSEDSYSWTIFGHATSDSITLRFEKRGHPEKQETWKIEDFVDFLSGLTESMFAAYWVEYLFSTQPEIQMVHNLPDMESLKALA